MRQILTERLTRRKRNVQHIKLCNIENLDYVDSGILSNMLKHMREIILRVTTKANVLRLLKPW